MKDLYKRLGLDTGAMSKDIEKALNASSKTPAEDMEDARYVLLNPSKKSIYDRTHKTLTTIGVLRASLDLNDCDNWRGEQYGDFIRKAHPGGGAGRRKRRKAVLWFAAAALVIMALIGYAWFNDTFREYIDAAGNRHATSVPSRQGRQPSATRSPAVGAEGGGQSTDGLMARLRSHAQNAYDVLQAASGVMCRMELVVKAHIHRVDYAMAYSACKSDPSLRASSPHCRAKARGGLNSGLEQDERDYRTCMKKHGQGN